MSDKRNMPFIDNMSKNQIGIEPPVFKVTENGLYNLLCTSSFVKVNVEGVKPTGTLEITENGEYDVTEKASANVNVAEASALTEEAQEELLNEEY